VHPGRVVLETPGVGAGPALDRSLARSQARTRTSGLRSPPQAALAKANALLIRIGEVLDDAGNYVRQSMGLDRMEPAAADGHE
jgi:hypothetical protein